MRALRLLDLFCGAGGATWGYMLAGWDVVGVDIERQKRYIGREFVRADAIEYVRAHGHEFDAIHASPPCENMSRIRHVRFDRAQFDPDDNLIAQTRQALLQTGKRYVIENVADARRYLVDPVTLCGTMFGLRVLRHRLFETNWLCFAPSKCEHRGTVADGTYCGVYSLGGSLNNPDGTKRKDERTLAAWSDAMQIDWMTRRELTKAIPPAYTRHIGLQLRSVVEQDAQAISD